MRKFVGWLAVLSCGVGTWAGSAYGQGESENDPGDTATAAFGSDCPPTHVLSGCVPGGGQSGSGEVIIIDGQAPSPGGVGGGGGWPGWRPPYHPPSSPPGGGGGADRPRGDEGDRNRPRLVRLVVIDEETGEQGEVLVDENGVVQSPDEEVIVVSCGDGYSAAGDQCIPEAEPTPSPHASEPPTVGQDGTGNPGQPTACDECANAGNRCESAARVHTTSCRESLAAYARHYCETAKRDARGRWIGTYRGGSSGWSCDAEGHCEGPAIEACVETYLAGSPDLQIENTREYTATIPTERVGFHGEGALKVTVRWGGTKGISDACFDLGRGLTQQCASSKATCLVSNECSIPFWLPQEEVMLVQLALTGAGGQL
jgi:hypothetical protein